MGSLNLKPAEFKARQFYFSSKMDVGGVDEGEQQSAVDGRPRKDHEQSWRQKPHDRRTLQESFGKILLKH